jgi:hypothetical protein
VSEITIAQPLSGEEIIDSVLDKIRQKLRQDCYLSPMLAYESYEADITVKIKSVDCGRIAEVETHVQESSEHPVNERSENFALDEMDLHLESRPPNQVRQEAGLPIPTLVEGADGKRTIKDVKYQKKTTHTEI